MTKDSERLEREDRAARLTWARKNAGFRGPKEVADRFGFNINNYKAHEAGRNGFGLADAKTYANAFGVSLNWLQHGIGTSEPDGRGVVPKVGYVGAGQAILPFDDDTSEWVEAPPEVVPGTVAVEVRGESMLPAYEDGFLLYYSKRLPPAEMLNKRCVVQLANGSMLVKTLRRGTTPGYWNLGSLNAYDIEDQVVEWAAPIDWIKPR